MDQQLTMFSQEKGDITEKHQIEDIKNLYLKKKDHIDLLLSQQIDWPSIFKEIEEILPKEVSLIDFNAKDLPTIKIVGHSSSVYHTLLFKEELNSLERDIKVELKNLDYRYGSYHFILQGILNEDRKGDESQ
ncbi:hypothetical protein V2B37_09155 [Natranaerobius thermophilus JW/NM-WN-LF]